MAALPVGSAATLRWGCRPQDLRCGSDLQQYWWAILGLNQ